MVSVTLHRSRHSIRAAKGGYCMQAALWRQSRMAGEEGGVEKRLTMSLDDIIKKSKGKPSNRGNVAADKQTKVRAGRATSPTLVFCRTSTVHWRAFRRSAVHTGGQTGAVLRLCSTSTGFPKHFEYCEGGQLSTCSLHVHRGNGVARVCGRASGAAGGRGKPVASGRELSRLKEALFKSEPVWNT